MQETILKYSEAFKRKVVSELESGKFSSQMQAMRAYDIRGSSTISRWLRKYGKTNLLPKVIRVETRNERDEVAELRKKNRELEKALAQMTVKSVLNEAYFEIVCEQHGVTDIEALKKKVADLQSKRDS